LQFIFGRRSVRIYSPGDIDEGTVTKLLEAAMAAPSAMTKDPWRFVVVGDAQQLSAMAAALPGGKMLPSATLAIVACGDLDAVYDRQLSFLLQDCSAAIENLLLAAHALGLGACWVGVHPSESAVHRLKELLRLPTPVIPIAAIALGYPGEQLEARTRYHREFVHRERWSQSAPDSEH
jgi:nitroreductase